MPGPRAVPHRRSRFIERVFLGRDAVRRWNVNRNAAPTPAAAQSSERRST